MISISEMKVLDFRWFNIPIKNRVNFYKNLSNVNSLSDVMLNWHCEYGHGYNQLISFCYPFPVLYHSTIPDFKIEYYKKLIRKLWRILDVINSTPDQKTSDNLYNQYERVLSNIPYSYLQEWWYSYKEKEPWKIQRPQKEDR